ncbi:MAG TPA: UDP-N-acetylglucosamine 1-carboxyvinyltransferase [Acidimicrobiales bacterium]|nr:UDP-N-acetylglucosamine 1-carboxyvinyltransferase [Acidimicrobiales bacterium]
MERFVVRPGPPLSGRVRVAGAKNSVLKLLAATLLAEGVHMLDNAPRIGDVDTMCDLLGAMNVDVTREGDRLIVRRPAEISPEAPYELVERMRASIAVLGPLLAREGRASVAMPGGDDFGTRPVDDHLCGLEALGARFELKHGVIEGRCDRLLGNRILLEVPSHTATDTILMAAVLAKGTTVIDNAAREPEVADLAAFLNRMGARVTGAGTSTIEVEGVDSLVPVEHEVVADRVEAATFLAAVGIAGGEVTLEGARPEHMDMLVRKLGEMGMRISPTAEGLWAFAPGRLSSIDVSTLPYPGVATDYKPLLVAMLSVADGVGIVTENLFGANRFGYVAELVRMGADIRIQGHHAVVRGQARLSGAPVKAPDLRAGAALVLAGLGADGETVVSGAGHILRGYEDLAGKLTSLGADISYRAE